MMMYAALVPPDPVLEELRDLVGKLSRLGVQPVPADRLYLLVARFGNLTEDIGMRLADALDEGLAELPPAVVWFSAPRIEETGDVVVDIHGEVERMLDISRAVPRVAEKMKLYVDRRVFHPELVVGQCAPGPRTAAVEQHLDGSGDWSSQVWAADGVCLVRTRWQGGEALSEEFAFVALHD